MAKEPTTLEERLLAKFNRRPPTLQELSGIANHDWNLNDLHLDRTQEILKSFLAWNQEIGPCPISINDKPWFSRLCVLIEWLVLLEDKLDPSSFQYKDEDDPDGA